MMKKVFDYMNKRCVSCKKIKPLCSFVISPTSKDGKRNYCKECIRERSRIWRLNNPEKSREAAHNYYRNNKEKVKSNIKQWNEEHTDKVRQYRNKAETKRMENRTQKLSKRISWAIRASIKNKKDGQTWRRLVNFTTDELIEHLEKQFVKGMTWENYGEWHIDHIIPITAFNFKTPYDIDFKRCWCLKNLRPLWAKDNIIKRNKLSKPFQPSLAMEA